LLIRGLAAIAVVSECTRGRKGFATTYDFQTVGGQTIRAGDTVDSRQEIGAHLCILYLPERPGRTTIYPLGSYRVVE
jgi:hypothetical protein